MRSFIYVVLLLALIVAGCRRSGRSSDDVAICKQFYNEVLMRMEDLKRDTFQPSDFTTEQLQDLTPRDPDWLNAQFLVLTNTWKPQEGEMKIVIICNQARVADGGKRIHCVGYSDGEIGWLSEDDIAKLPLRDYSVLPKVSQ